MVCRHTPGDTSCSSHPDNVAMREHEYAQDRSDNTEINRLRGEARRLQRIIDSPNAEEYDILDVVQCGPHMVLKVQYPSCTRCSYEGIKIMVFKNTSTIDALKWRKIDPHFSDPSETRSEKEAPSPAARFPANDQGWNDAVRYANGQPPKGMS